MLRQLGMMIRNQKGFTLIEILVAVPLIGLIGVGAAITTSQVFSMNEMGMNKGIAIKQVENAVQYISRDAQQAQIIEVNGSNINLSWKDWTTNNSVVVSYANNNNSIQRRETINTDQPVTLSIANYITGLNFTSSNGVLNITITASVGGFKPAIETRTFQIKPRPGQ
jgi:prepilin-type N-terminal cleavage/methylation domain-containing protein